MQHFSLSEEFSVILTQTYTGLHVYCLILVRFQLNLNCPDIRSKNAQTNFYSNPSSGSQTDGHTWRIW